MAKKLKEWFDGDCATLLGCAIKSNHYAFDIESYTTEVVRGIGGLELKDRVGLMSDALRARLPKDYKEAAEIIFRSLGPPLEGEVGINGHIYYMTSRPRRCYHPWILIMRYLVSSHAIVRCNCIFTH